MTLNSRIKMGTKIRVIPIIYKEVKEEKRMVKDKLVPTRKIAQSS